MTACANAHRMAPPLWQQVYDRAIANGSSSDEAQTLDSTQKQTARDNIGAASADDLTALSDSIGDPDTDFAAAFNALLSV